MAFFSNQVAQNQTETSDKLKTGYSQPTELNNTPYMNLLSTSYTNNVDSSKTTTDDNGNVLDFPFLNGARYVYDRRVFSVLAEKNKTKKYRLGVNDITNIDSLNNVDTYTRDVINDLFGDNTAGSNEPYKPYTDEKC